MMTGRSPASRVKRSAVDHVDSVLYPYPDTYDQPVQTARQSTRTSHVSNVSFRGVHKYDVSDNRGKEQNNSSASQLQIPNVLENTPGGHQSIRSESFSYSRYPEVIPSSHLLPDSSLPVRFSQPSGSRRLSGGDAENLAYNSQPRNPAHTRSTNSYSVKPAYTHTTVVLHDFLSNPPIMLLKRAVDRNTEQTRGLDRPATSPSSDVMLIESTLIPWQIRLHAHPNTGYLSIADVLNGIYKALQEPVMVSEYARLDTTRAKAVKAAYFKRIDQESTQSGEPIKKIDWLEGRYVFGGLYQSSTEHDVWNLRLGWPRRR